MNEDNYKIKTGIHTGGTLPAWSESDAAEVASILDGIIARRAKRADSETAMGLRLRKDGNLSGPRDAT